ncbi:MAG: SDR family oxidoreductase [Alicyclobacillaceae bacterium]|nr:SDR family oxidoreductase [Alicyclobacillaceae bacterium]
MRFVNKVAIVTGGGGGIGRATAQLFAREGARVTVADIDEAAGRETVRLIEEAGGIAQFCRTDVTSFESVTALVRRTVDAYGRLDIMFNNAGVFGDGRDSVLEMPVEEYHRVVRVNQDGVFYGIKAAAAAMRETGGVIINTASIYAYIVDRRQLPYHASKAAVVAMTKAAALELAKYNIRVVAVAPGMIDTPLVDQWRENEHAWNILKRAHMRGEFGKPEQVAKVVAFLASDDASFVNGHAYFVDDGAAAFKR